MSKVPNKIIKLASAINNLGEKQKTATAYKVVVAAKALNTLMAGQK